MSRFKDIIIGEQDAENDNSLETAEERKLIRQLKLGAPKTVRVDMDKEIVETEPVSTEEIAQADIDERREPLSLVTKISLGLVDDLGDDYYHGDDDEDYY